MRAFSLGAIAALHLIFGGGCLVSCTDASDAQNRHLRGLSAANQFGLDAGELIGLVDSAGREWEASSSGNKAWTERTADREFHWLEYHRDDVSYTFSALFQNYLFATCH